MNVCFQFDIPDVATRISEGYVSIKIQRDPGGGYVEISGATTRPPLRDVVSTYVYQDPTGDLTWDYRAVLIMSDGTEYGTPYAATSIYQNTYTTLQDVRDEGVLAADISDARVESFIEVANQYIEDYTNNWFTPQFKVFEVTGENRSRLFLDAPIIAVQRVSIDNADENISNLVVNNRYLRNGLTSPDDRKNPMITYSSGYAVDDGQRLYSLGGGSFPSYRQETKIWGIFGYTELPRGGVCGETETGSQVPLNYGGVPDLIKWCATQLVVNRCFPTLSDGSLNIILKNRMTRLKTRDQEVEFSDEDTSEIKTTDGFTNSTAIDQVLNTFRRPVHMKFV
ncbi:MAG: hypothetical protein GY841_15370 [FCB group bacterium]|nr:hypothetical protein [FCB group bacterium]